MADSLFFLIFPQDWRILVLADGSRVEAFSYILQLRMSAETKIAYRQKPKRDEKLTIKMVTHLTVLGRYICIYMYICHPDYMKDGKMGNGKMGNFMLYSSILNCHFMEHDMNPTAVSLLM